MSDNDLCILDFKFSARDMLRLNAAHARMDFLYEEAKLSKQKGAQVMDKVDKIMDVLLEEMDARQLWHVVFNKMTSAAKRQMLNELLNQYFGGYVPVEGSIFESTKDE